MPNQQISEPTKAKLLKQYKKHNEELAEKAKLSKDKSKSLSGLISQAIGNIFGFAGILASGLSTFFGNIFGKRKGQEQDQGQDQGTHAQDSRPTDQTADFNKNAIEWLEQKGYLKKTKDALSDPNLSKTLEEMKDASQEVNSKAKASQKKLNELRSCQDLGPGDIQALKEENARLVSTLDKQIETLKQLKQTETEVGNIGSGDVIGEALSRYNEDLGKKYNQLNTDIEKLETQRSNLTQAGTGDSVTCESLLNAQDKALTSLIEASGNATEFVEQVGALKDSFTEQLNAPDSSEAADHSHSASEIDAAGASSKISRPLGGAAAATAASAASAASAGTGA
jgi:hypothetical protein